MKHPATIFVTGTDTGVGKTVLTVLLVHYLRARSVNVAALKPVCSGNRDDARKIYQAMNGALAPDEINPWHFRVPIAPLLAARRENRRVKLSQVLVHARAMQKRFDVLLVEGAGGLLSPLGEDFNSRALIKSLDATPIVVCQNRLGAVNQILLTLEALPKKFQAKARVVLMSPPKPDVATRTNAKLIAEFFDAGRIFELPWFGKNFEAVCALKSPRVRQIFRTLSQI